MDDFIPLVSSIPRFNPNGEPGFKDIFGDTIQQRSIIRPVVNTGKPLIFVDQPKFNLVKYYDSSVFEDVKGPAQHRISVIESSPPPFYSTDLGFDAIFCHFETPLDFPNKWLIRFEFSGLKYHADGPSSFNKELNSSYYIRFVTADWNPATLTYANQPAIAKVVGTIWGFIGLGFPFGSAFTYKDYTAALPASESRTIISLIPESGSSSIKYYGCVFQPVFSPTTWDSLAYEQIDSIENVAVAKIS